MLFTQTLLFASLSLLILASPLHFKRQDSISAQVQATPTQAEVATPAETGELSLSHLFFAQTFADFLRSLF